MKYLILVISLVLFSSCDQEDSDIEVTYKEENAEISNAEIFEIFLSKGIPVEGGFKISQQAEHFSVSEIQYKESGLYYIYVPAENFFGNDVVKILSKSSNGAEVFSETVTTINIKVTE